MGGVLQYTYDSQANCDSRQLEDSPVGLNGMSIKSLPVRSFNSTLRFSGVTSAALKGSSTSKNGFWGSGCRDLGFAES